MKRAVRWIFLALLVIELILLFSGLIPAHIAAIMIIVTESTALILGLSIIVPTGINVAKRVRAHKIPISIAIQQEFKEIVPKPLMSLFRAEVGMYAALVRGITRKHDVPKNSAEITYGKNFRTMAIFILCLTPIEIAAIELMFFFLAWPLWLHIIVIVITVYTVLFFLGMILSTVVYPHFINPNELQIKYMFYHTIFVETQMIESVSAKKRECKINKTIETDPGVPGNLIALNVWKETNVVVRFKHPYCPIINGEPTEHECIELAFNVNEPDKAVCAIQDVISTL